MHFNCKITLDDVTTVLPPEELIRRGYRRVSNAYCLVARIDRPDWVDVLAAEMHRPPADFYLKDGSGVSGSWCAHYRSVYSKDVLTVHPDVIRKIHSSSFDPVGYVSLPELTDGDI